MQLVRACSPTCLLALPPLLVAISCAFLKSETLTKNAYVGSETCVSCHESRHPQLLCAWWDSRHRWDMRWLREGSRGQNGPDPNADGILWVIGREDSRHVLVRADLRIVPSGGWQDDELWPPHKVIAEGNQVDAAQRCLGCHATGHFVLQRDFSEPGVGWEACHGPAKEHTESRGSKASIVNPGRLSAARSNMICGQCHSLGGDRSGVYPFPVMRERSALSPFQPGRDLALAFVDSRPKLARKGWEYSLFVQAAARYSSQRCTDCHDPHGRPGSPSMLRDPTSETCLRCHGIGRLRLRFKNHWGLGDATKKPCWNCHRNSHVL